MIISIFKILAKRSRFWLPMFLFIPNSVTLYFHYHEYKKTVAAALMKLSVSISYGSGIMPVYSVPNVLITIPI